jgi:hypothetical protein
MVSYKNRRESQAIKHPVKSGALTVAGKPGVEVPKGTLNAILKQSGLKKWGYADEICRRY